jgi:carbamoyl-phosphate synthase large subunit
VEDLNICLLGAGNRVSLCEWLIGAGETYNKKVNIFSVELESSVPIYKYAKVLTGLKWKDLEFNKKLLDIVKKYNIQIILPLMDAGTVVLSKCKTYIEKETKGTTWVVVSSAELCEIFNDKILSEKWFKQNNILIPDNTKYPKIIKNKLGYGSRDQFLVNTENDFNIRTTNLNLDNYIIQSFIGGPEYTVDAYVSRHNRVEGIVTRQRLLVINGEVNRSITKKQPDLIEKVIKILEIGGFLGPITLQFIQSDIDQQWYMVEINPRLGGGVIHSLKSGANFCECMVAEYLGYPLPDCQNWEENLLMMRANQEIWINEYNN